jgi:hypothetical protein
MSEEQWLGLSGLVRVNDELRIGGELLFSVKTKAPGGLFVSNALPDPELLISSPKKHVLLSLLFSFG